ncbi:hypothetical protein OSB04_017841 [Centaurea solstitialis]|uniref:Uncharacterized protein n=1 Tax=Centaurea solstitialis TaxID=347529 RepID=A0AA38TEL4_9ASTR|nr:hypothetical protein OSB04_017841 [Centaurea solstitialis]
MGSSSLPSKFLSSKEAGKSKSIDYVLRNNAETASLRIMQVDRRHGDDQIGDTAGKATALVANGNGNGNGNGWFLLSSLILVDQKRRLVQIFQESVRKQWNRWELRGLVLISLALQVSLIYSGNRRKYIAKRRIRAFIWCAYLLADWIATVALGILVDRQGSSSNYYGDLRLMAFWAPFLLLHLGGPDTITAYALADNELWLRHFLGLLVQTAAAIYITLLSWNDTLLSFLTIPMLLCGIIKYGERTWVLMSADRKNLQNSFLRASHTAEVNYTRFMEEFSLKEAEGYHVTATQMEEGIPPRDYLQNATGTTPTISIRDASIVQTADYFFETLKFKRLLMDFVLSFRERDLSRSFFQRQDSKTAFQLKILATCPGKVALETHRNCNDLNWTVEAEFDHSILIWHVATDICYKRAKNKRFIDGIEMKQEWDGHMLYSKQLANYMLYLLVECPFMLPIGIGMIRFQDTCIQVLAFLEEKSWASKVQIYELLGQVSSNYSPGTLKVSESVLFDACNLAAKLNSMNDPGKMWKMVNDVWMEILGYAAGQCNGFDHAQQLHKGGELLTHVWLLMAHLGLTKHFKEESHGRKLSDFLNEKSEIFEKVRDDIDKDGFCQAAFSVIAKELKLSRKVLEDDTMESSRNVSRLKSKMEGFKKEIQEWEKGIRSSVAAPLLQGSRGMHQQEQQTQEPDAYSAPRTISKKEAYDTLKKQITSNSKPLQIISVFVEIGIENAPQVETIYKSRVVKQMFPCRAWLVVDTDQSLRQLILDILQQVITSFKRKVKLKDKDLIETLDGLLEGKEKLKDDEILIERLHGFLKDKKYLIVIKDIKSFHLLEKLRMALPVEDNGSRVVITTPDEETASFAYARYRYEHLDMKEALKIFIEKIQGLVEGSPVPGDLMEGFLEGRIAKICRGNPLRFELLVGFLSTRKVIYIDWRSVLRKNVLPIKSPSFDLLAFCYDALPFHLKPCFLYLGLSRKGYEISVRRLFRLWVAEGFVKPIHGEILEDTVEAYLKELVQRNMVEITKRRSDESPIMISAISLLICWPPLIVVLSLVSELYLPADPVWCMVRITNAKLMEKYEEASRRLDGHDEALKQIQVSIEELKVQNAELSQGIKILLAAQGKKITSEPDPSSDFVNDMEGDDEGDSSKTKNKQGYQLVNRMTKLEFPSFDGEAFKDWYYKCNQFFELDNTPENMKIRLVSIHLKGRALQWHQGFMSEMEGKTLDWEKYLAELRDQFVEGIVSKPLIELRNLKLTTTVSEYNSKFNALRNQVAVPPDILLDLYIGGLTNEIMHTVQLMDPKTLNQAMKLARIQEGAYYALWGLEPPKPPEPPINNFLDPSNFIQNSRTSTTTNSPAPTSLPSPKFLPSPLLSQSSSFTSDYRKPPSFQPARRSFSKPVYSSSSNQSAHNKNPIKQLTKKEYDEKRRNNQCFFCNERYVPGHKCKNSKLYMLLCPDVPEEMVENGGLDGLEGIEGFENPNPDGESDATMSIHALLGSSGMQTLQVKGMIKKQEVNMLVDSGSTNNFIDLMLAKKLGIKLTPIRTRKVSVADGFVLSVHFMCKSIRWSIQGVPFVDNFLVIPLGGYGAVLGIQWLSSLGDIKCNFQQLVMEFTWLGKWVKLKGTSNDRKSQSVMGRGGSNPDG